MGRLGISIYPEQTTFDKDKEYLDTAHKYGYKRIFTSLLEITEGKDAVLEQFKKTIAYANSLDFDTIIDINPSLFNQLGITYDDLSFFNELGVWGIRLDEGFTGLEEAAMTRNPYGLKIEVNMSAGNHYIDNIMAFNPDKNNLLGCHNFYPQEYTALGDDFFEKWSALYTTHNLNTAAFVSSETATFGPWPIQEGLPTLELDRHLSIDTQVKHLLSFNLIDDIIIGNACASEEELKLVADTFNSKAPSLRVELSNSISNLEKEIVLDNKHIYRGDASDYLIRDTQTRVKYADQSIPKNDQIGEIQPGDILVLNDKYSRYKGELQIALKTIKNDGRRNIVGRVAEEEKFLVEKLPTWSQFRLVE